MYQKEFDRWNEQKKKAHSVPMRPMFKERDVWWCSLGVNVGDEQDGKGKAFVRPVLVLKKFNRNICVALPLSTQLKDRPYYYQFDFKGIRQSLVLSQIRLMDVRRFRDKMGEIPTHEMGKIKERLQKLIF